MPQVPSTRNLINNAPTAPPAPPVPTGPAPMGPFANAAPAPQMSSTASPFTRPGRETVTITPTDVGATPNVFTQPAPAPAAFTQPVPQPAPIPTNGAVAIRRELPAWLTKPQPDALPSLDGLPVGGQAGDFISYAHPASGKFATLVQAGCKEGDFFARIDGNYVKTMPLQFFLFRADVFQTEMEAGGAIVQATRNRALRGARIKTHVLCLVVAWIAQLKILKPLRADFRATQCDAGTKPLQALEEAQDPDWPAISADHRFAASFPHVGGRVFHTITTQKGVSTRGEGKGKTYYSAIVDSRPSSTGQLQALIAAMQDQTFIDAFVDVDDKYNTRVKELDGICKATLDK